MSSWISGACQANAIQINYLRTGGAKPPVVLLHGLMGSGRCWTPLARELEDAFDVVMPDARGHGASSAPHHGYRYDDHADDVAGLIGGLGLVQPALLGHSMGGMTAAVVASRAGVGLRGLVLADPTFLSPAWQREVRDSDVVEQHRQALKLEKSALVADAQRRHPRRAPEVLELSAEARLQTRMGAFDVLTPPNPEFRQVVRAIAVPTLVVIGDSPVVSLETAMELGRINPRVRVEQLRDCGHAVPQDQPERFAAVVRSFLAAVHSA